jgi:hypothetical protein
MKAYYFYVQVHWKMVAKIAGMDATSNKACAIGAARRVGVVDKVGQEMDVMAHLGDLDTTIVCLNHQFLVIIFSLYYYYILWQYGLWSFQMRYIKLERFLPQNQHTQRKFLNF